MGKEHWMWLACALGYGAVNTGEILEAYPEGPQAIMHNLGGETLDSILTQKQAERLASTRPEDFSLRIAHAEALGVSCLPYDDPLYPDTLRNINTPPIILYVKGDVSLLNGQLSIGMVGARRPSAYGVEVVKAIGRGVALGGAIIVSGLAAGLDAEAHKAALSVNGPTIACIAFGHDNCYPAANRKLMDMIEKYGAVISEYPLGTSAEKPYFLQRNRLIAGLSHGLVVAESRKHSGTMSTVNFASDYGRDVFAVPGSVFSELSSGTNALIREGAYVAASATDVLSVYGIELKEEDPIVAASRHAMEGRPLAASVSSTPAWAQNTAKSSTREDSTSRVLEQQTLGEALQGFLETGGASPGAVPISSKQAIDAFRRIQQDLPSAKNLTETHNAALEMRAEAVTDDVVFSDFGVHRAAEVLPEESFTPLKTPVLPTPTPAVNAAETTKNKLENKIKTFSWDKVEHLSKEDAANTPGQPTPEPPKHKKNIKQKPSSIKQQVIRPSKQLVPPPLTPAVPFASPVQVAQPAPITQSAKLTQQASHAGEAPLAESVSSAQPLSPLAHSATMAAFTPNTSTTAKTQITQLPAAAKQLENAPKTRVEVPQRLSTAPIGKIEPVEGISAVPAISPVAQTKRASSVDAAPSGDKGSANSLSAALGNVVKAAKKSKNTPVPKQSEYDDADAPLLASRLRTRTYNEDSPAVKMDFSMPYTAAAGRGAKNAKPARPIPNLNPLKEFQKPANATTIAGGGEIPSSRIVEGLPATITTPAGINLSPSAQKAYAQLGAKPISLNDICERSKLSPGDAMAALTELELSGLSRQLAGRQFVISQ